MSSFVSADVFINEFLPETSPSNGEWIELYNNGSSSVSLTNWNISDESSNSNLTLDITIAADGFVVLSRSFAVLNQTYPGINDTGIVVGYTAFTLNNPGDGLFLYNDSSDLVDSILFAGPGENVSVGRYPDGSTNILNSTTLTPGDNNDNATPVFNKWATPSANNSFIGGLFNITINVTDVVHTVNVSIMEFNNSNFTMNRSGDIFYFLLNTSPYDEILYNNITIYFNDSVGLSNTDTLFNITVDNTKPNITLPQTSANSRNYANPGFKFNASVNSTDTNLFNVTCILSGTTVGNFSSDGNTYSCNLTSALETATQSNAEQDFEITFTAIDKAGNTNTTTANFTTKHSTIGSLTPRDITISDMNQSDKIIQINVSLNNTGSNRMYDTGIILHSFESPDKFSTTSYQSCASELNSSQNCTITFNVTIDGGTTGTHNIFWKKNWTDRNFSEIQFVPTILSTVTIDSNPRATTAPNVSSIISHGENSTISLDINSTGNSDLGSVTMTFTSGTIESSWLNVTTFSLGTISAATNATLDVNVKVPKYTNPGNYTGTFSIAASSISSKTILLTVEVPTDDSWISSPNETITYSRTDNAGIVGKFSINNTGNVGHNFTFYPPVGNFMIYETILWNTSNIRDIYVEAGRKEIVSISHLPMSGTPGSDGSFNLTFTITSQNTSQTNTSFMSLIRDDNNPNVNITNPINNSYPTGTVEFNVSASDLNLSRIEYYINDGLVLNSAEINFTFNWNTTDGNYPDGNYALKAIAYDSAGNFNSSNINVTVNNTDDNPIFVTDIPTIDIIEDNDSTILNLSLYFNSIDGDSLEYNFTQPGNVTVHVTNTTQIANFTPDANFIGLNNITFTAIDSSSNTTSSNFIIINVANLNDAPTVPVLTSPTSGSNVTSSAGAATLRWSTSVDVDNDVITYYVFLSNDSSDIRFNATTTSTNLQLTDLIADETYFWNVLANDSLLNSSKSSTFNFTIIRDNNPVINLWNWSNTVTNSTTDTSPTVAENKTLNFTVTASDPDGDSINYTWFIDNVNVSYVQNFTFDLINNFTATGNYVLKVQVQDNNSNSAEQEWQVAVTNTNREPALDPIGNKNAVEDTEFKFNITAIDPDNNTITFDSNITAISFTNDANNSMTTVSWTPTNDNVGSNTIEFTVNDNTKNASETITIDVTNTNDAPTITSFFPSEDKTIAEGVGIQRFDITFEDVDVGDNVNATWFGNTTGTTEILALNSSNVTLTGLGRGIYNISVKVNDTSGAEARNEWTLTVTTGMIFDELTTVVTGLNQSDRENVTNVTINQSTFGGIDFGNETMNFSRVASLEDAFNISEGLISVDTATYPELNRNASIVMKGLNFTKAPLINLSSGFEDTAGGVSCPGDVCTGTTYDAVNGILRFNVTHFSTYSLETNTTNGAPVLTSTPGTSAIERADYAYDVDATDPDGDILTFSLIASPTGMSIASSTGLISWSPTLSQIGLNDVAVNITDGSLNITQSFQINVVEGPKLIISDLDIKVNGKTDKNVVNNTMISEEIKPGLEVEFKLEIENLFTKDEDLEIEDIDVEIIIEDIDDGSNLEEDADEFDLKPGKNEDIKINFDTPWEIDEGVFDVIINVEGKDENGTTHEVRYELELEAEKKSHEIEIIRSSLTPSIIKCQRQISINTEIINIGSNDEDDVTLEITSAGLEISSLTDNIELDEGTDDNRFTKQIRESISSDILPGAYPIAIDTYYDGKLSDSKTVDLTVGECELARDVKEKVKEEKPKVEVVMPKSIADKKPVDEISSTGTSSYKTLMAILVILFLGTAVFIVGAGYVLLKK